MGGNQNTNYGNQRAPAQQQYRQPQQSYNNNIQLSNGDMVQQPQNIPEINITKEEIPF